MHFKITNQIFEKYPELTVGVVRVQGLDNSGVDEEVMNLIHDKEKEIRAKFNLETLGEQPNITAWREAYRAFGAKPKKYKCSVENLYRMILEGVELKHINKLVDIYNYVSLKHVIPVGGDDLDKVEGGITLTLATGAENFIELNSDEVKHPKAGEVIYKDDKEVLCRRWNFRECDKSKMTEETKNALLVVEGLPPVSQEKVEGVVQELGELAVKYCGGEVKSHILHVNNGEIEL